LSRRIAASVPFHLSAPTLVARTDLIVSLPSSVADLLAWPGVRKFPLPLPHPGFRDTIYWHKRNERDPAHRWIRDKILGIKSRIETDAKRA
jgi:LysR family transcriptional regulator, mexEF-oprN operon transcriptional activator